MYFTILKWGKISWQSIFKKKNVGFELQEATTLVFYFWPIMGLILKGTKCVEFRYSLALAYVMEFYKTAKIIISSNHLLLLNHSDHIRQDSLFKFQKQKLFNVNIYPLISISELFNLQFTPLSNKTIQHSVQDIMNIILVVYKS